MITGKYIFKKISGVTLLELVVVISIFMIMATIGVLNWSNIRSNQILVANTRQLAADLRYARQVAMSEGSAVLDVTLPPPGSATGYAVKNSSGGIIRQSSLQGLTVTLPNGAQNITCNQNGTFSIGGTIIVTDPANNRSQNIAIVQRTGAVTAP